MCNIRFIIKGTACPPPAYLTQPFRWAGGVGGGQAKKTILQNNFNDNEYSDRKKNWYNFQTLITPMPNEGNNKTKHTLFFCHWVLMSIPIKIVNDISI